MGNIHGLSEAGTGPVSCVDGREAWSAGISLHEVPALLGGTRRMMGIAMHNATIVT